MAPVFVGIGLEFNAVDAEGDPLTYVADILGPGMTFNPATRKLGYASGTTGVASYGRIRVSTASGGSDVLVVALSSSDALAMGGPPAALAQGEVTGPTIGPNPTRGSFVFPSIGSPGAGVKYGAATVAEVFDLQGRRVAVIRGKSNETLMWDGRTKDGAPVHEGIYVYRLQSGKGRKDGKIVVVR